MSNQLTTIATFWNPVEANLARARVEDAGVEAALADEGVAGVNWLLTSAVGGIKLQVREGDAERALEILAEVASPQAEAPTSAEAEPPTEATEAAEEEREEPLTRREQK